MIIAAVVGWIVAHFDLINAAFEGYGAYCAFQNVLAIRRDKKISGIRWQSVAFFAAWGYWNLIYYPALGQWFSVAAGAMLALFNTIWVAHAIYYRRKSNAAR